MKNQNKKSLASLKAFKKLPQCEIVNKLMEKSLKGGTSTEPTNTRGESTTIYGRDGNIRFDMRTEEDIE